MPDWCLNQVVISGPTHKIKNLWDALTLPENEDDRMRLLNHFKPQPEELKNTNPLTDSPNWMDWSVDNWGTKWDICYMDLNFKDHGNGVASIDGNYATAYDLAKKAYEYYLNQNKDISMTVYYFVNGNDVFGGCFTNTQNIVVDNLEEISKLPPEQRPSIYQDLDKIFDIQSMYEEVNVHTSENNLE